MVGKIVGAASFLSIIALVWLMLWQAQWNPLGVAAAMLLFLLIGAFALIEPAEWRKAPRGNGR